MKDQTMAAIVGTVIIGLTLILLAAGGVLFWAYQWQVQILTIQARVLDASCYSVGGARKRAEGCVADLWLSFTYNETLYYNVSVLGLAHCGYYCNPPLPTNATVYIDIRRNDPYRVTAVETTNIEHNGWYAAGGALALALAFVGGIMVAIFVVDRCQNWQKSRSVRRDEADRIPLLG